MRNTFESVRKYDDNLELAPDSFRFQSAGKKYINQNYKRIGHVLGVEGEWLGVIKRRANSENRLPDIHGDLSLKQINFYREHYDFPPLTQDEYEAIKAQNTSSEVIKDEKSGEVLKEVDHVGINLEDQEPIPTGEVVTADIDAESQSDGVEVQGSRETDQEAQTDVGTGDTINEPESVPKNSIESSLDDGGVDDLFENLPEVDALQAELDRLIEVEPAKLQKEEIVENLSYKVDREKLETFKENARQAIANYQQFANEHSSLVDKSNPRIQERYQLLEKQAWNSLYNLAHLLDGEIATLPQDRDIQVSHPEGADIRQYLEARGYKFDENGDVTHITDKGVEIELNRAMKTDSLIKSKRPSHIVYDKSISLDSDFNYQGYLVRGLNQQTPDFIVGVLDKDRLESVIVDETLQSNNLSEGVQDPWAEEVKGATEFDKIFADSLKYNNETQISDEMSDPWVEKSETEEPPIIPVFTIPSGDNPDLQSEGTYPLGEEGLETTPQVSLNDLRLAYARAEEAWNRKRGDEDLEDAFMVAREAYNTELERVLKLQVAEGQADNISKMFKDEVMSLRDSRIEQSQELQGKWEKRFNNAKEKFLGWATQNKTRWMLANISLFAAGALLSWTGAGIPVSGALEMTRRSLGSVMSGVSSRNTLVGLMEDGEINRFGIKFKAVIPKLVDESLKDDYINNASDDDLRTKLSTLEAYYRLNGGEFPKENQQQAYEKVLTELARRVQENVIDAENNKDTLQSDWQDQKPQELTDDDIKNLADENLSKRNIIAKSIPFSRNREIERQYDLAYEKDINWEEANPDRYTSELLNTISDTRIAELDKFRRKRKIANVVGFATTGVLGGLLLNDMVKPGSMFRPDMEGSGKPPTTGAPTPDTQGPGAGPSGVGAPETGADVPKPNLDTTPPTGTGASAEEALRQAQVVAEQAQELAQDVSSLDSGETIWGEIAEQLGENASQGQIQQAVENYLQSELGQESIYKLAQGTEGGRELLAQWGIDNADAMASLSKDQLFEISRYLAPGELEGITELSIDNLDALSPAEYVESSPVVEPTVEPGSTEPPAPPASESAVVPPTSEAPPVAPSEFTRDLSEILGKQNLTDIQAREIVQSYFADDYGRVSIYNSIINTDEGARFLSQGFNIKNPADFANLTPDKMYEITNSLDADSWRRIINETVLSKFETADIVEIAKGDSPLGAINRYIAGEVGNLPYDTNLGKQVLDTYLQTDSGKQWLYDAIVSNPNPNNQNVQLFREYLRFKDIKSPEEFVTKFNWSEFSGNRNIPTSGFWNQIRLPNGGAKLQPLSTFLQPSKMTGIPEVIKQVLTRQ
jgi:hypothetical protein